MITGSGTGIGEAIAKRFAEAGANLDFVDIDEEGLNKVKGRLEGSDSKKIDIRRVDLSGKREIDALWTKLEGNEPDILVNNAGIYPTRVVPRRR